MIHFWAPQSFILKSTHGWALRSWPWEPIAHFDHFNSIPHHCSQLVYLLYLDSDSDLSGTGYIVHINSHWISSVAVKNTSASVFLVLQDSDGWIQGADWELGSFKVSKRFQCTAKVVQAPTERLVCRKPLPGHRISASFPHLPSLCISSTPTSKTLMA